MPEMLCNSKIMVLIFRINISVLLNDNYTDCSFIYTTLLWVNVQAGKFDMENSEN